jgi:hypothetical protein
VRDFEKLFLERMRVSYPELLERLGSGEISREVEKIIEKEASEICSLLKTENS